MTHGLQPASYDSSIGAWRTITLARRTSFVCCVTFIFAHIKPEVVWNESMKTSLTVLSI